MSPRARARIRIAAMVVCATLVAVTTPLPPRNFALVETLLGAIVGCAIVVLFILVLPRTGVRMGADHPSLFSAPLHPLKGGALGCLAFIVLLGFAVNFGAAAAQLIRQPRGSRDAAVFLPAFIGLYAVLDWQNRRLYLNHCARPNPPPAVANK
jgi:hypothetical protein